MSKYQEIDGLIIDAVKKGINPLYNFLVRNACEVIAEQNNREIYRVIDGRLQALRKAGKIRYLSKSDSGKETAGWYI